MADSLDTNPSLFCPVNTAVCQPRMHALMDDQGGKCQGSYRFRAKKTTVQYDRMRRGNVSGGNRVWIDQDTSDISLQ